MSSFLEFRHVALSLGSREGLADLVWLSTLGADTTVPAWLARDVRTNNAIEGLAHKVKFRRRMTVRTPA